MRRMTVVFLCIVAFSLAAVVASASVASASANGAALTPEETLGKSIFFDAHLSLNQNQSCATCHAPEAGWTGPDASINTQGAVYEGSVAGRFGDHKPPSSAYATLSPILHFAVEQREFVGGNFWNGRATGEKLDNPAADQAQGPFLNPAEQALPDSACVVYRVCNPVIPADYPVKFEDVWGADACAVTWPANIEAACAQTDGKVLLSASDRTKAERAYDQIALAITAYEASSASNAFTSKYDYFLQGVVDLTWQEKMGMMMFMGKGRCATCHPLAPSASGEPPLFTDFSYHNLGLPANPANPVYGVDAQFVDQGLGGFLAGHPSYASYAEASVGKLKVPTLRNVDLRPSPDFVKAYGHNGYFTSLEAIVHFYNTRDLLPQCPSAYTEAEALAAGCWPAAEVAANLATVGHGMGMGMHNAPHMQMHGPMGMGRDIGRLRLTAAQEAAIVAFLKTLSDGYEVPAILAGTPMEPAN